MSPLPIVPARPKSGESARATALWQSTLTQLKQQTTKATFNQWLTGTRLIEVAGGVYTIECANEMAVEWLEHRLKRIIERTLCHTSDAPAQVTFVAKTTPLFIPPDDLDDALPDGSDAEFVGAYHDARHAIIQPKRVEVGSQYFRLKWRPLLGPLLSELIRELRQRCYFKSNRNAFKTTHKSLAEALGVSQPTIKRALARDKNGRFKNEYLCYFIQSATVVKSRDEQGAVRNRGTRFVIYLDEPLTPQDQAKLTEGSN